MYLFKPTISINTQGVILSKLACCVHVVDVGTHEVIVQNSLCPTRQIALGWELVGDQTTEGRSPQKVYKTYDLSFTEGSTLRLDLESWMGDQFKNRIRQFDLKSLLGKYCMLELVPYSLREAGNDHFVQKISLLPTGFDQAALAKPLAPFGVFKISTPDMEMFKRLPHAIQEQIKSSPECNWLTTKWSASKYRFPTRHQFGTTAKYVKLTKEKYYCRINHPDGTNTFHYTYYEDPGGNQFSMSQDDYKAVRGISEQLLESW